MRTSFCTIAFQKDKWGRNPALDRRLTDLLPLLARAGYDGVEIWWPHLDLAGPDELDTAAGLLRDLRLAVPMIAPYFDFTTSVESAARSRADAQRVLAAARRLGAGAIRVFTGRTGSAQATEEQWSRTARHLADLADQSRADGIAWALELHGHNLMDTLDGARRLLDRVDRPNVGLIAHAPGDLDALDALPGRVLHVHARQSEGNPWREDAPGAIDYRPIIARLRAAGFHGFLSVEYMGASADTVAPAAVALLRRALA